MNEIRMNVGFDTKLMIKQDGKTIEYFVCGDLIDKNEIGLVKVDNETFTKYAKQFEYILTSFHLKAHEQYRKILKFLEDNN